MAVSLCAGAGAFLADFFSSVSSIRMSSSSYAAFFSIAVVLAGCCGEDSFSVGAGDAPALEALAESCEQ